MTVKDLIEAFRAKLSETFPGCRIETAKSVQQAVESVAAASGKPLFVLCPGDRMPASASGRQAQYLGLADQAVLLFTAVPGGIARRGETVTELADFTAEAVDACMTVEGGWTSVRWESSVTATLPDGFPLEAYLSKLSVTLPPDLRSAEDRPETV